MAGMSSLSVTFQVTKSVLAQNNLTGADYSPNKNNTQIAKSLSIGTAANNNAAGGSDEEYSAISTIGASSSVTISLLSLTDLLGTTAVSLARIKALLLRLLSAADDATNGTAASSITVDGTVASAFLSSAGSGWLTNATSKIDCPNGGFLAFGTPSAAGVLTSGASAIKITNNDVALSAKAQLSTTGGSS